MVGDLVKVPRALSIQKEGGVGKYLGLPEQFGRRKRDLFSSIVDRIEQKAKGWSTKFLSSAGKLVMLQSVLSAGPSYSMTYFKLPVSLCKRIQSVITRFWWDSNEETKKMAWISWDRMAKPKALGGLGVKDFLKFNDALLVKSSWRLLNNPACLLGQVLKGKYFPECNILQAEGTSTMSHGWRSVLIGCDLLQQNLGWIVGDGQSINIWRTPWLNLHKQESPMGPATEQTAELLVSDLMIPGTLVWDRSTLQRIPAFEEQILHIQPSLTGAPDKLVWLGTKSGEYSTKSGYYTVVKETMEDEIQEPYFNWRQNVWSLNCAPKVKHFAWRLLKRAVPVGERLVERHIDVDPNCKRCGAIESIIHLIFQCPFTQQVWSLAPFVTDRDIRGTIDLMPDWHSLCNLKCLPPSGISAGPLALWIMWSLWKARNKVVFEGFSASPAETLSTAISLAWEWIVNSKTEAPAVKKTTSQNISGPSTAVVVRTDAAWCANNNTAGLGWTILSTDQNQEFQERRQYVASPLMAESFEMREAIRTCRRLELKALRFESDSTQLIKCINGEIVFAELLSVVADIRSFSAEFEFVSFIWIPREKNSVADLFAKNSLLVAEPEVVEEGFNGPL